MLWPSVKYRQNQPLSLRNTSTWLLCGCSSFHLIVKYFRKRIAAGTIFLYIIIEIYFEKESSVADYITILFKNILQSG